VLAIAGIVTWLGYGVFVYGFSQVRGQNYSIGDLLIPGKYVPGVPADSSLTGSVPGGTGTGAGTVPFNPTTGTGGNPSTYAVCANIASGARLPLPPNGKCPAGYKKLYLQA